MVKACPLQPVVTGHEVTLFSQPPLGLLQCSVTYHGQHLYYSNLKRKESKGDNIKVILSLTWGNFDDKN